MHVFARGLLPLEVTVKVPLPGNRGAINNSQNSMSFFFEVSNSKQTKNKYNLLMLRSVGQRLSSSVKQGNMRMEFLIVLSPAKTLDETTVKCPVASTKPLLGKGAEYLADALGKLTRKELDKLLGVKGKIGCLNFERYQNWMDLKQKQAGMMFSGAAYKTLRFPELDSSQMTFAQSRLRILCGLYGVLRPCDKIRPYRLDMSKKLSTAKGKNNYEFWGSQITDALNKDIKKLSCKKKQGGNVRVINVASQEYFKSIHVEELNAPVITCMFPGPSVYAKMARGAMTRYLISNEIDSLEKLKEFDGGDYYKGGCMFSLYQKFHFFSQTIS